MHLGIPELIAIILGTGGLAGTVTSIVQARRAIREGARTDERGVLSDSEEWRRAADDARRAAYRPPPSTRSWIPIAAATTPTTNPIRVQSTSTIWSSHPSRNMLLKSI